MTNFAVSTPPTMDTVLQTIQPGEVTSMFGTNGSLLPQIAVTNIDTGGYLLYSDDPETVPANGIMYTDSFAAGTVRVYVYHTNGTAGTKKISVVGKNMSATTAMVKIYQRSVGNGWGYTDVGKQAVSDFLQSTTLVNSITISSGGLFILDSILDSINLGLAELAHGIYDVYSNQSVKYSTCMLNSSDNTLTTFSSLTILGGDGYNRRGTFPTRNRTKIILSPINTAQGMQRMSIARPYTQATVDLPLVGTDAITYSTRTLSGNYGILYKINIPIYSSDTKNISILVNPRGGPFGGAFQVDTGIVLTPFTGAVGTSQDTAIVVTKCTTLSFATTTVQLQFIPPGASSLPIELVFAPYSKPAVPVELSQFETVIEEKKALVNRQ